MGLGSEIKSVARSCSLWDLRQSPIWLSSASCGSQQCLVFLSHQVWHPSLCPHLQRAVPCVAMPKFPYSYKNTGSVGSRNTLILARLQLQSPHFQRPHPQIPCGPSTSGCSKSFKGENSRVPGFREERQFPFPKSLDASRRAEDDVRMKAAEFLFNKAAIFPRRWFQTCFWISSPSP